jgi:hypothetical protein
MVGAGDGNATDLLPEASRSRDKNDATLQYCCIDTVMYEILSIFLRPQKPPIKFQPGACTL